MHLAVELGHADRRADRAARAPTSARASPSLHAWGRVAKALADASGVVPIVSSLVGPAVSGPALLLGIADHVIMTTDAFAYVSGPEVVVAFTGVPIDQREARRRGDPRARRAASRRSSSTTSTTRMLALEALLAYLPAEPPRRSAARRDRRPDRPSVRRARVGGARARHRVVRRAHRHQRRARRALVPRAACRVRAEHGDRARAPRRATGRHRRQPADVPGRHPRHRGVAQGGTVRAVVRRFNFPIVTFVDTPGLRARPGPRVARHDPPRRRARPRLRRGDGAAARASCCARRTAARTS